MSFLSGQTKTKKSKITKFVIDLPKMMEKAKRNSENYSNND